MSKFIIQGGKSLEGEITVSGAKNSALKLIAASLMTDKEVCLANVPDINDVRTMISILEKLGAEVDFHNHNFCINCATVKNIDPDYQLIKHMRASVMIIGPLLARFGAVKIPQPGGCLIGARPINTHINALKQLNVEFNEDKDYYYFRTKKLTGGKVILDEMSVTATENVLMASVLASGKTEIHLAASEPEIVDLADLLNEMGAKIVGAGTSIIKVTGVSKLNGAKHTVIPDRIEAGTFAVAAAVSRGDVRIKNVIPDHLDIVLQKLTKANVNFEIEGESVLHIKPTTIFSPIQIDTRPHPGFPTDLQAPFSVLLTQANGTSKIFETMYDGRLGYCRELKKMGANIDIIDNNNAIISGPTPLYGKEITSFDIRAGATLLIAAIIAQGQSVIDKVELIDRGYEKIEQRLSSLGANIKRI
ncbi:MAG: UDP-N-acetylglucosamine 1-carboxyvinyltransferase [Patescibacteria group bacterium]|jgi:UDP-N-acetylglucosamine 1-carboxyvinyltransferase